MMECRSEECEDFQKIIYDFEETLNVLGFTLRKYQRHVANDVIKSIREGHKFIVVSMPTGSGKTLVEIFTAFYGLKQGAPRVLVLEPTRFLCDQMCSGEDMRERRGLWSKVFGESAGKAYEGNCYSFLEPGKKIVVSTPQTALKCAYELEKKFGMVVIDEVHHAFGGKHYMELLVKLKPSVIVGFTALLPSYKKYRLDTDVENAIGSPHLLVYDFRKLEEIDPDFKPPKAIADVFDAEMNERENKVYDALFRAILQGNPRVIKFLEATLARYGKEAFCESYKKALEKNSIVPNSDLENLCESDELSHKARTLIDVLAVYDIKENNALKPILTFTSRKATANEFRKAIIRHIGLSEERIAILTSDMRKEERLELVKKAKNGEVDVIISTLVGEEGVDIPEAGLLIMTDAPKNPLRFYQRLGRLIRMSSQQKIKYLVVSLTPKTVEYSDLDDALWNLKHEGIDVSYIIVNIDKKVPSNRVVDIINSFGRVYRDGSIPYTLLAFGQELSNPINYVLNVANKNGLTSVIQNVMKKLRLEDPETAILYILRSSMISWVDSDIKKIFEAIDDDVNRGSFSKEFDKAIRERKIFYAYDIGMMSEILSRGLQKLYETPTDYIRCDEFFRIDHKSILRLFTRAFPYDNIGYIIEKLEARLNTLEESLDKAKKSGLLKDYRIRVSQERYNERAKALLLKVKIYLKLDNIIIELGAQINYYDIDEELLKDENVGKLINTNLLVIGYEASKRFLDYLYETSITDKADSYQNYQGSSLET